MQGLRALLVLLLVVVGAAGLLPASVTASTDPEDLRTLAPALELRLREWLVAWRVVQPRLRVEDFERGGTGIIGAWRPLTIDLSQKNPRLPLYVFSPDGRWVVDPFGGLAMSKRDESVVVGFQPDSFVLLYDRRMPRMRQVLACGTTCGFQEAAWLTNDRFVVAGYGEGQPKEGCRGGYTKTPILYLINLPQGSITTSIGSGSCEWVGIEYVIQKVKQKIPNVKFPY